jgi:cytochrome b6-f complex iron-sulfur subunit
MERKEFILTCGMACIGGAGLATILQSCATSAYYAKTRVSADQITIPKSEFTYIRKDKAVMRDFVLTSHEKFQYPICIYRLAENQYSALLLLCTHKGCELNPLPTHLSCPCHGSEFDRMGGVQNPPAEQNLQAFQIKTDDENIYIQL